MKRKRQVRKFLEDNYCMINGLMCEAEKKSFDGDVVKIIMDDIDRQIEKEVIGRGRITYHEDCERVPG